MIIDTGYKYCSLYLFCSISIVTNVKFYAIIITKCKVDMCSYKVLRVNRVLLTLNL